jgi:hypothetical protein
LQTFLTGRSKDLSGSSPPLPHRRASLQGRRLPRSLAYHRRRGPLEEVFELIDAGAQQPTNGLLTVVSRFRRSMTPLGTTTSTVRVSSLRHQLPPHRRMHSQHEGPVWYNFMSSFTSSFTTSIAKQPALCPTLWSASLKTHSHRVKHMVKLKKHGSLPRS